MIVPAAHPHEHVIVDGHDFGESASYRKSIEFETPRDLGELYWSNRLEDRAKVSHLCMTAWITLEYRSG